MWTHGRTRFFKICQLFFSLCIKVLPEFDINITIIRHLETKHSGISVWQSHTKILKFSYKSLCCKLQGSELKFYIIPIAILSFPQRIKTWQKTLDVKPFISSILEFIPCKEKFWTFFSQIHHRQWYWTAISILTLVLILTQPRHRPVFASKPFLLLPLMRTQ